MTGIEPGYIKRADLAWYCSHHHSAAGENVPYAYSYLFARRFDDAIAEFELALRLNPNFAFSHAFYAVTLCYAGRYDEGDVAIRRALRLSPRDPMGAIYQGVGAYIQFACGRYDEAIKLARESLRQRADFVGAHRVLTAAAGMAGDRELSAVALQGLRQAQPRARLQTSSALAPSSDSGKIASRPSPMNFSTSPP